MCHNTITKILLTHLNQIGVTIIIPVVVGFLEMPDSSISQRSIYFGVTLINYVKLTN